MTLAPRQPLRDPKTELQEWAQGRGLPTPIYQRSSSAAGPTMRPRFSVEAQVDGCDAASGVGRSKREAEQDAAREPAAARRRVDGDDAAWLRRAAADRRAAASSP